VRLRNRNSVRLEPDAFGAVGQQRGGFLRGTPCSRSASTLTPSVLTASSSAVFSAETSVARLRRIVSRNTDSCWSVGLTSTSPRVPSDGEHVSGANVLARPAEADHRRHHSARAGDDDRGVRGLPAQVGDERRDAPRPHQQRRVRAGLMSVRDDDRVVRHLHLFVDRLPEEVSHQPVGDELDVRAALAKVFVFEVVELVAQPLGLPAAPPTRPVDPRFFAAINRSALAGEERVVEHHAVRFDDVSAWSLPPSWLSADSWSFRSAYCRRTARPRS